MFIFAKAGKVFHVDERVEDGAKVGTWDALTAEAEVHATKLNQYGLVCHPLLIENAFETASKQTPKAPLTKIQLAEWIQKEIDHRLMTDMDMGNGAARCRLVTLTTFDGEDFIVTGE